MGPLRLGRPRGLPATIAFACWPVALAGVGAGRKPSFLSAQEWREFRGLAVEKRRREWLAGRLAAKVAARARLPAGRRVPLSALSIERAAGIGPRLRMRGGARAAGATGIRLSIAHSGEWAVAGSLSGARCGHLGLDLEGERPLPAAARRFFLRRDERDLLRRLSPVQIWALKEAAYKSLGPPGGVALTEIRLARAGRGYAARWTGRARAVAARAGIAQARCGICRWRGYHLAWAVAPPRPTGRGGGARRPRRAALRSGPRRDRRVPAAAGRRRIRPGRR